MTESTLTLIIGATLLVSAWRMAGALDNVIARLAAIESKLPPEKDR